MDHKLLPDSYRSPFFLAVAHLLPKAVMGMILARAWLLVAGEAGPEARGAYLTVAALEVLLAVAVLGVAIALRKAGRETGWKTALALFAVNVGTLWAETFLADRMVPGSVASWMLSPGHLVFAGFCFTAPALFYCAVCVAGVPLPLSRGLDIGSSFAAMCLVPTGWYIAVVVIGHVFSFARFPFEVGLVFFIASTAVLCFAFLRLLLWLYRLAQGTLIPALLAGLLLPLAGLALNIGIPFPADLQYVSVYVLTIVNGVILVLPVGRRRGSQLAAWWLRSALYPFTLYFFLLFLPFLPMSIVAMLAAGAGFLILAPTFLFVIHTRMLFDERRRLREWMPARRLAVLFALALAVMPAAYTARARWHRAALMRAVDAVYSSDFSTARPRLAPRTVRAALVRLQNMKRGLYLPFLSELYNRLVFDGMVLPDHKVSEISRLICGEDLVEPVTGRRGRMQPFMFLLGSDARNRSWANAPRVPRDVVLEGVALDAVTTNGVMREARLILTMHGGTSGNAEFQVDIGLSPGLAVSGYELEVDGQWVPGRIFDRKTALWVYHMIRDVVRRDPGLLHYVGPGRLELRVFPFAADQTRHCALRVLYPAGLHARVDVGGRELTLSDASPQPPLVLASLASGGTAVFIPPERARALPSQRRPSSAHFLLDVSAEAVDAIPDYGKRVEAWLAAHPDISHTAATAVNFASFPLAEPGTPASALPGRIRTGLAGIKAEGGFCPELAAARDVYRQLCLPAPSAFATTYVLIGKADPQPHAAAAELRRLVPDTKLAGETEALHSEPCAVLDIRFGGSRALLSADEGGWVSCDEAGESPTLTVTDANGMVEALAPDCFLLAESRYSALGELAALHRKTVLRPGSIDEHSHAVLSISRQSGILAPETAYIVVENTAQWRTLERAEQRSLGADHALEFDEFVTPEPSAWLVGGAFLVFLWLRRRACHNGQIHKQGPRRA